MDFAKFTNYLTKIALSVGCEVPKFQKDQDSGLYRAEFTDGTIITANSVSGGITANAGGLAKNHCFYKQLATA